MPTVGGLPASRVVGRRTLAEFAKHVAAGKPLDYEFWWAVQSFVTGRLLCTSAVCFRQSSWQRELALPEGFYLWVSLPVGGHPEHVISIVKNSLTCKCEQDDRRLADAIEGPADIRDTWETWWGYMECPCMPAKLEKFIYGRR
jgi:hypothetical protein